MMNSDKKAIGLALLAVLSWSTVATAFKLALASQSLYQLLWLANLTTLIILAPLLMFSGKLWRAVTTLRVHFRLAFLLAVINPVAYYLILFRAYELLPAQVAQPINYTWAIVLAVLSVPMLGHQFTRRDALSMVAAYFGVILISFGGQASGQPVTLTGVGLALLSTLLWAFYWLLNTRDKREPVTAIFQNFLLALPLTTLVFWYADGHLNLSVAAVGSAVYVGLFEMGLTFVFWLSALRLASRASLISNLIFISPFLSLILIATVLDEKIGVLTIAGLFVIIGALYYQNKRVT